MSKLKKPVGFFEQDENKVDNIQKKEITAKHLDAQYTNSLRDQEPKRLGDQNIYRKTPKTLVY